MLYMLQLEDIIPHPPPVPPPLLLFENSHMKNMVASHSTQAQAPVLSSSTQLEFELESTVEFSSTSGLQAGKVPGWLESA